MNNAPRSLIFAADLPDFDYRECVENSFRISNEYVPLISELSPVKLSMMGRIAVAKIKPVIKDTYYSPEDESAHFEGMGWYREASYDNGKYYWKLWAEGELATDTKYGNFDAKLYAFADPRETGKNIAIAVPYSRFSSDSPRVQLRASTENVLGVTSWGVGHSKTGRRLYQFQSL